MKTRVGVIALFLSMSVCAAVCKNHGVDRGKNDKRSKTDTFAKYYEPYELDIKPNSSGYKLPLDINDIVNFNDVSRVIDVNGISSLIRQNGFAILEPGVYSELSSYDFDTLYRTLDRLKFLRLLPPTRACTFTTFCWMRRLRVLKNRPFWIFGFTTVTPKVSHSLSIKMVPMPMYGGPI